VHVVIEIIGRADEAAAIARFLDRLPTGPAGLLLEGEPGIGKTTIWHEATQAARTRGHRVLQARPAEAEAELSFAALGDLMGGVFDEVRDALPVPQRQALEVALLLREAAEPADPLTTASALLTVVTALARADPLVVAIDDVQWMDQASTRALEFAVRRLPQRVGIVVARRIEDGSTTSFDLGRALPPDRFERLALGPLSLAAVHHLVRSRLGLNLSRPILVRITEASGGNPFYALELAMALAHADEPPGLGDLLPVPRTLHELLNERLGRLSPPARAVASAAAALSRPTAEIIAGVIAPTVDLDAALLETEEAGVLVSDGHHLRFRHPLLASAMYGSLASAARRDLHRRLARVVEDLEERARHLARSFGVADAEAAATIEEAAALASRRGAPESAAELFEAACRLTPPQDRDELARRTLGAAQARSVAGDLSGARDLATDVLEAVPAGSLRARALLLLGGLASYTETTEARIAYQEQALSEAGDDVALRVEILLALFEQIAVDPSMAARRADEAIELLRGREDPGLLARALISSFVAHAVLGRGADGQVLEEALDLEARSTGPVSAYPLLWFHWTDQVEATRVRHRLHDEIFRDLGDVVGAAEMVEFVAMTEFRAGNWTQAEQLLDGACETLAQLELRGPIVASFADRAVIDAHRGRSERARQTISGIRGVERLETFWQMVGHSAEGAVEFCCGDHTAADRAWTTMRDEARVVGWRDFLDDRSEPDHVEALIALGKVDEARGVLDHLEWRGRTLPRPWIEAGLPRARALMLAADGKLSEALALLDGAPAVPELPFEHARLLLVKGQIERRANRKLAAKESLTSALVILEELGSPPWEQRARDEIARLGLRHRASGELTEGERRIAELAAAGMTNRQVADAAFVSPKTVEANLARVYRKLGIRSRAELGARMEQPREPQT
jgi:DNA-binding CsgD family transcriptional regulator/tetratricopeptide (TPR) repeat protein